MTDTTAAAPWVIGLYRLSRPLNAAIMALGVGIGAVLAGGSEVWAIAGGGPVFLAMLAAVAIGIGANAINDVFDCEIDRVNRPTRPLPAGIVSMRAAQWMWGLASVIGIVLAAMISWLHAAVAIGSVGLLYLYSAQFKRRVLVGNVAVSVVVGLAIVFGGLVPLIAGHGSMMPMFAGAGFAFLTTLAREIAKDVEDMPGDARAGARTLPIAAGIGTAAVIGCVVILITLAALPAARVFGLGPPFLALSLPAAAALIMAGWWLLQAITDDAAVTCEAASRASSAMKVAMLAGLAALAIVAW